MDDDGEMKWGVEVEPPEDMDDAGYSIDPQMKIWKSMTGNRETLKAEEDLDDLYHPSVANLLPGQIENLVGDTQAELVASKNYQEPEEDKDDMYHPNLGELDQKTTEELLEYQALLRADYKPETQVRVSHYEPEKDMDDLYHMDVAKLIHYQGDAEAAVPFDEPSQRRYSEPEEDLDYLYHQWSQTQSV